MSNLADAFLQRGQQTSGLSFRATGKAETEELKILFQCCRAVLEQGSLVLCSAPAQRRQLRFRSLLVQVSTPCLKASLQACPAKQSPFYAPLKPFSAAEALLLGGFPGCCDGAFFSFRPEHRALFVPLLGNFQQLGSRGLFKRAFFPPQVRWWNLSRATDRREGLWLPCSTHPLVQRARLCAEGDLILSNFPALMPQGYRVELGVPEGAWELGPPTSSACPRKLIRLILASAYPKSPPFCPVCNIQFSSGSCKEIRQEYS